MNNLSVKHSVLALIASLSLSVTVGAQDAHYSDSLQRPDSWTLGSSWVEKEDTNFCGNDLSLRNNHLRTVNCFGGFAYWNASYSADQYSTLVYFGPSGEDQGNDIGGPAVRINTSGDQTQPTLYYAEYDRLNHAIKLWKHVSNGIQSQPLNQSGTQLGSSYTATLAQGDALELDAIGTTISVLLNGSVIISATDSAISGGVAGVAVRGTGTSGAFEWTDWYGGNLVSTCAQLHQDTNPHTPTDYSNPVPPIWKSSYTSFYGCSVTRLTNVDSTDPDQEPFNPPFDVNGFSVTYPVFMEAEYATQTHFNSDSSRIMLQATTGGAWITDQTGTIQKIYSNMAMVANEPRWDRTRPNYFYYHTVGSPAQVKRRNIVDDSDVTVFDASATYATVYGHGEWDLSHNGNNMVLIGATNGSPTSYEVFVLKRTSYSDSSEDWMKTGALTLNCSNQDDNCVDWLQVTDNYVVIGFRDYGGAQSTRVYDLSMHTPGDTDTSGTQLAAYTGHEDVGNVGTSDILVMVNAGYAGPGNCDEVNSLVSWTLPAPSPSCLLPLTWAFANHIALPAQGSPWVYISTHAPCDPPSGSGCSTNPPWTEYTNELFRIKLDGSAIERLAHHYSRPYTNNTYEWTPRSSVNADGSRVLFNSNFGLQHNKPSVPEQYGDVYMIKVQ